MADYGSFVKMGIDSLLITFKVLYDVPHGGECCGITHIHEFHRSSRFSHEQRVSALRQAVQNAVEDNFNHYGFAREADEGKAYVSTSETNHAHAVECVLTSAQLELWQPVLDEVGFKQVFEFRNGNSGNVCHVFYLGVNQ